MKLENLVVMVSLLQEQDLKWDRMWVEAEIGSEQDLGLSVLQDAFSFRVCDSRPFQRRDSWYKVSRQYGHRSEPYAGDSGHKLRSLRDFWVTG